MPDLVKYGGHVVMNFEGTNWMNQEVTEDYLSKVIDNFGIIGQARSSFHLSFVDKRVRFLIGILQVNNC